MRNALKLFCSIKRMPTLTFDLVNDDRSSTVESLPQKAVEDNCKFFCDIMSCIAIYCPALSCPAFLCLAISCLAIFMFVIFSALYSERVRKDDKFSPLNSVRVCVRACTMHAHTHAHKNYSVEIGELAGSINSYSPLTNVIITITVFT